MIRVTVEHIEENHEDEPKKIASMDIVSDGTGAMDEGNYAVERSTILRFGRWVGDVRRDHEGMVDRTGCIRNVFIGDGVYRMGTLRPLSC